MLDNARSRGSVAWFINPIAKRLLAMGISADAVTWAGTIGTSLGAVLFISTGHFLTASIIFVIFSATDLLDGTMARMNGTSGPWGSFLDSSLDRITDAAVFGSVAFYLAQSTDSAVGVGCALVALAMAATTSYIRAKAESIGADCKVGFAERAERNIIIWTAVIVAAFGWTGLLIPAVVLLAVASSVTVIQRLVHVRRQLVN